MSNQYQTIVKTSEAELKEKGSKFIAIAFPFNSESQLKGIIETLKSKHTKARHFCYAYRIRAKNENSRANDDGEPSGSAGKPILNTILSKNLSDVLVVVIRYFGGTLLGVPGLINAYKNTSLLALESAEVKIVFLTDIYLFTFNFEHLNELMKIVKEFQLKILEQLFVPNCNFKIEINRQIAETTLDKFVKLRIFEIEKL
jgi:uncharacterized YigZ family protein